MKRLTFLKQKYLTPLVIILFFANPAFAAEKASIAEKTKIQLIENVDLPALTRTMQQNLQEAASEGDLEEVRDLFETNELTPVLTDEHIADPITYWKDQSADGTARDTLATLAEIFALPAVKIKTGDYIWPYLSQIPLKDLTPHQQIDLFRLVGPKQAIAMLKSGKYSYYEAQIGKDGTWHHFKKIDPK